MWSATGRSLADALAAVDYVNGLPYVGRSRAAIAKECRRVIGSPVGPENSSLISLKVFEGSVACEHDPMGPVSRDTHVTWYLYLPTA